jgi:hypothetical protein
MGTLRESLQRVLSFFHKQHRDSELDAEVAAHLDDLRFCGPFLKCFP